jgi:predicted phosphatase
VVANAYKTYQLRGYASLRHVARKFKVPANILEEINGIDKNKRLFPKTVVYLPFREDHTKKHELYADLYEKPRKFCNASP